MNLFDAPSELPDELTQIVLQSKVLRIERIVSRGHASAAGFWYDQSEHEWVAVLSGCARLEYDDGSSVELGHGSHVLIPAHRRHRVAWTDPNVDTVWLAVFFQDS